MLALRDVLAGIWDFPVVRRNANLDAVFEGWEGGDTAGDKVAVVLREGELSVTDVLAGDPLTFNLTHQAQVEWFAYGDEGDALESLFDAGMVKIADAIAVDPTLGGVVADCRLMTAPEYASEPFASGIVKSALIPVTLFYNSTRPF